MAADALVGVLGAFGSSRRPAGRRSVMPRDEPVGDGINDVEPLAALAAEPGEDAVSEGAETAGEVGAGIALEAPPFAFLLVELGAIARQPDDVQPVGTRGQCRAARLAGVARTVVQHEIHLAPGRRMPLLQRF